MSADILCEQWRPVPGFPHYEASSLGRVRSLDRMVQSGRGAPGVLAQRMGKVLKSIPTKRGYLSVKLVRDGLVTTFGVHQVVAMAFHGLPPAGHVVDHVNTDKTDNRPGNLEYVTNGENVKRQYRTGLLTNRAGGVGRWRHLTPKGG